MLSLIEIDREHDLAYILLQPELRDRAGAVSRSMQIGDDVVLDLDSNEQLIGIELLNASTRLDLNKIQEGFADLIVGVKEAAEMLRVEKPNFIRDYANKARFPRPIAELASGRLWLRSDIERYVVSENTDDRQDRLPIFNVGEVVILRSDPTVFLPIIEVLPGGVQYRYRVFQSNGRAIYYESQLERTVTPIEEHKSLTVRELHAHLTSFQILSPSTAHLFSLRSGRVHFVPYQYRPVLRLIRADRPRLLIADEVGVGKTIEAGLVIKELRARMEVTSVLVICPKALVAERKWLNEMKRFDEQFVALDGPLLRHCLQETDLEGEWPDQYAKAILPFSLFDSDFVFGRNERAKKTRLGLLGLNPPPKFDLVIVDEAHHIRNPETLLHEGVRYFCDNAQAVLLLTATPVQLGSNDLFTLLNVLRPDLVIDQASFEQMAAPNPHINAAIQHCRVASPGWQRDAGTCLAQAAETEWGRLFLADSPAFTYVTRRLERNSIGIEERIALTQSVEDLYTFSSLINRTRRRDIGEFTTRKPETLMVDFTPAQKELHDHLLDVIAHILTLSHGQQNVKFMMTTVRRQAASCLYGLTPLFADILSGKLDRLEQMEAADSDQESDCRLTSQIRDDVEALLSRAKNLDSDDPKAAAFVKVLLDKSTQHNNKALVFSTFRHTLSYLNTHAQNAGLRVALVHGDVPDEERSDLRHRFSLPKQDTNAIDVLLSSEVGCEGLDFQFCDFLINYDLPWNPMRIEQRIGRIDRYGQQSQAVGIINFITPGTVDADIYERCLWRIGVFQHAVGGNEEILGEITKELHAIAESLSLSEKERAHRLQQLTDNTIRQVREEQELEAKQSELFGLNVPSKSWRDDIKAFETFWLSPAAIQTTVKTYLAARLESTVDHVLGDKPLKTLRLNQEARGRLLDDYRSLPRSVEPVAREWEKYLRGSQPTLALTFDQEAAVESPRTAYLSVLHPLVRQAARYWEVKEPKYCTLTVQNDEAPLGPHHFALYRWTKHGVKVDEELVAVCDDLQIEALLLTLLQSANETDSVPIPNTIECEGLEARHHVRWADAQSRHIDENRRIVEHRIQSLTVSHRARCSAIEDQVLRATNDRIRLMKESELLRASADFDRRLAELQQAAGSADVRANPLVFGTLTVERSRVV
jgi:superfamily II DNA or RNA helicase/uncharacterized protein YuzE